MYHHITRKERATIALLLARKRSYTEISREIGVHRSTISREVRRNKDKDGTYRAIVARRKARRRHCGKQERHKVIENNLALYQYVTSSLEHYWSPEQIAGRLRKDKKLLPVSHTTIYAFMERERKDLKKYLRHRKHRKRTEISFKQGLKRMIDTRPKLVEKKKRIGDWEGDTIVGLEKTERILTHVDRKSGLLLAHRTQADSDSVRQMVQKVFAGYPAKTITYDNGSEFAAFQCIEKDIKTKVYFAHPGKPYQRGSNENANGLLRQFFPKGTPFGTIPQRDVHKAATLINNRPRKRLDYRTPLEFFTRSMCCT